MVACSSVNVPLSPYRIDVQQGNALEQEAVDKLKPGLSRSQVRFLLGTPLLVDPFHGNRWDYVYNFRKAGKLIEQKRLVLFFEGDVLSRIEAEGVTLKPEAPPLPPAETAKPAEEKGGPTSPLATDPPLAAEPLPAAVPNQPAAVPAAPAEEAKPQPAEPAAVEDSAPAPAALSAPVAATPAEAVKPAEAVPAPAPKPAEPAPEARPAAAPAVLPSERSLDETSIVRPLRSGDTTAQAPRKPAAAVEDKPEPVALQEESNVEGIKPDVMPEFPNASLLEGKLMEALNAWAEAWRTRNEDAYLAAYASSFRPAEGLARQEWEKRRRLLLGMSHNIDLKIEEVTTESLDEQYAQISFKQYYRSDTYKDAVAKRLKFVRADDRWLIEEETVLGPIGEGK